jgi:hypothetical protein
MIKNTGTWRYAYWYIVGLLGLTVLAIFLFYHPPTFRQSIEVCDHNPRELLIMLIPFSRGPQVESAGSQGDRCHRLRPIHSGMCDLANCHLLGR